MAGKAETGAADAGEAAEQAGLVYVSDELPGFTRRRAGRHFRYRDEQGGPLRDKARLARIRKLAIPPAYTDVWISPDPLGHIQATGRDDRGRKQYRYHDGFREAREASKYAHILEFASALPRIRKAVSEDIARPGLPREKVLATVVRLLETTMIRVGNADYAKQNKSYGLTTLRDRHVDIAGSELKFHFKGKSGKQWRLRLSDRRVAKVVKACQDLPGQHLFQYVDGEGARREVTSGDINLYLKEISGRDITAKDFRTWSGTLLAALALNEYEKVDTEAGKRRNVRAAIETVAARLGNTPAICRKCYIHPEILESYLSDELALETKQEVERELREDIARLTPEEAVVLAFLHQRLA